VDVLLQAFVAAVFGLPATLYALTALGVIRWGARERARQWRAAARAAGLSNVEESPGTLAGRAGPLEVRLSRHGSGSVRGTRIAISGPGVPTDLTVRPEGAVTLLQSVRGLREIEVGHDTFDAAAWVQGRPAVVRAVLDGATRRALRALFEGRLERPGLSPFWATGRVDEGVLLVDVPEVVPRNEGEPGMAWAVGSDFVGGLDRLHEVLPAVLALAGRLVAPEDVPRRLADNLKSEPVAGVRRQLLATLAREFPDDPATREAVRAAREDPDAEVRLRAGIALGPEGRDVLLAIAGGEGAPDETTERAVVALGFFLTADAAQGILRNALRTRREATARACLGALGQRRGAGVVATLAKVLAVEKPELAAAAADALGATGDASAEAPLLGALGSPHAAVRVTAARALGRVGTTAAVLPLKGLEARDGAARATARQAIALIQSRVAGAAPGQLSLAGGESGQLSLASEEQGRLSLVSSRGTSVDPVPRDPQSSRTADSSGDGRTAPSE
jgi:HEAT repeat protein